MSIDFEEVFTGISLEHITTICYTYKNYLQNKDLPNWWRDLDEVTSIFCSLPYFFTMNQTVKTYYLQDMQYWGTNHSVLEVVTKRLKYGLDFWFECYTTSCG